MTRNIDPPVKSISLAVSAPTVEESKIPKTAERPVFWQRLSHKERPHELVGWR